MTSACVNRGGPGSLIRLAAVPRLEHPAALAPGGMEALDRWEARPGEILTVVDSEERFYRARVERTGESAMVVPFETFSRPAESPLFLEVCQALPEKERFELILQKLTELGVKRIVPFVCRRSTTVQERDALQRKSHRWPDVVLRAAKQCRRAVIPELFPVLSWDEMLYHTARADLGLILYEGKAPWSLRERLQGGAPSRMALVVGPEGGFDPAEVEEAAGLGLLSVSAGPRILRTETAAIAGAAVVQYALGDLGE